MPRVLRLPNPEFAYHFVSHFPVDASCPLNESATVLFPISDDDRHLMHPARVTIALVVVNVALFLWQLLNPEFTNGWSVVPYEITHGVDINQTIGIQTQQGIQAFTLTAGPSPIYLTIFSAMFMHGGWMHLGGNLLYLWIFGDNVEHRFGSLKFLAFYLFSGIVATFAQIAMNPDGVIPNLGASGAISGVLGAYLVLFPRNRVNAVFFFFIVSLPAVLVLGMWGLMQFVQGAGSFSGIGRQTGGVAYAAHIGGFIAGVVMGVISRVTMKTEPESVFRRLYQEDSKVRRFW
jgi:membrane associated rhomboid family serine protease